MTTKKKIFIGGLGALTPVIMNLLVVDFNILVLNLTLFAFLGYLIRVIVLFYLGGVVAYLHKDEKSPVKIFEFGIIAPALLTALINANNVDVPKISAANEATTTGYHFFISSVYAQTTDTLTIQPKQELKTFSLPKESIWVQLYRGAFAKTPRRVWFVIAGSHLKLEDAIKQAKQINDSKKGFKAEVYKPYGDDPHYRVVIGENLVLERAQLVQKRATMEGVSKQVTLWTFP